MDHLTNYGWNDFFAAHLDPQTDLPATAARIIQEHKEAYLVHSVVGNIWAEISGKMRHTGVVRADFPAVGDWVILRGIENLAEQMAVRKTDAAQSRREGPVQIVKILPRKTTLARRLDADEQLLAANIDYVFLGTSLNENFNLRRLERYLTMARESGAQPVVLLTKSDLCKKPEPLVQMVREIAGDAPIHPISALTGQGIDAVRAYLTHGKTAVILGSSGVGKSTLVNHLADADIQDMMDTRDFDDKGRHCTTFRHLVKTPAGGLIIDTPGLRGLALGEATDALISTFADIEALTAACKFTNCLHDSEPGCAIKSALELGTLDPFRLENYLKLRREIVALTHRENRIADRKQKKLEKRTTSSNEKRTKHHWQNKNR